MLVAKLNLGHQILYQPCRMLCCSAFKGWIIHLCRIIRLIGDGTDDDEGNLIQIGAVGDGSTFHLGAVAMEKIDQPFLYFLRRDELVTADYMSQADINFRVYLAAGAFCQSGKSFIRRKFPDTHLGYFA